MISHRTWEFKRQLAALPAEIQRRTRAKYKLFRQNPHHPSLIEGTLIAKGTDKQSIKFTPKGEQKPGAWGGIVFEDTSIDAKFDDAGNYVSGSILQYCTVEFAETGVTASSASPFIDHCVISNNASEGISIFKGDIIVIMAAQKAPQILVDAGSE